MQIWERTLWNTKDKCSFEVKDFRAWSCWRISLLTCVWGQSYRPFQRLLPMPSQCHVTHVQGRHQFQMLQWHSSFPSIPSWKAWLFLWARHIEVFYVFHMVCRCKHMQEMEKSYLRNEDTRAHASIQGFLVPQGCCWGHFMGIHLRAPNLQACTLPGSFWCLKNVPSKCQDVVTARGLAWRKQGCDAQRGAWPDRPESISAGRCKRRPLNTTHSVLLQSQGKRGKSMEESRTAAAYSRTDLAQRAPNPDLYKQFLASSTSSLMHHLLVIWLLTQLLTHSLIPP